MKSRPWLAWELALTVLHVDYDRRGLAKIERNSPPVRVLSPVRNGRFEAAWAGDGPLDFGGTGPGGVSIWFDAKYTVEPRFCLSALEGEQARKLERHRRLGAVTFIALRCPRGDLLLPWEGLADTYRATPNAKIDVERFPTFDVERAGWLPLISRVRVAA